MSDNTRPPVVTILGHVDHGKTSLLDRLRHAQVAAGELGGITQSIGAYQIEFAGKPLTFIDTPGHAAFSAMRKRGGKVADIAILVVAADDGVMPQTKESIQHIKSAAIPYVVAINKVDLPDANPLKVKQDLAEVGEYVEGYGGNIPVVEISAKTGQGVDKLLETVLLVAELEELKDTQNEPTQAIVIESQLHPQKGPIASLLVKSGRLTPKSDLYAGQTKIGKVRALINALGKSIDQALPSTPVQVLGFTSLPNVGDLITTIPVTAAPKVGEAPATAGEGVLPQGEVLPSTDEIKSNIILKADVAGSLEAILGSLPTGITVTSSSVGAPNESDVKLAAAEAATIICFNIKASGNVTKLAQVEKVEIVKFGIIYELFDYLTDLTKSKKIKQPEVIGEAKVVKTFPFNNQMVLGCLVTSGKLRLGDNISGSKIISLRLGKEVVKEVKKDQECGLILEPQLDIKLGESIIAHSNV